MVRLRKVSHTDPGWSRRRRGRGFEYLDERGRPLATADVQRIRDLVIPPAWQDVWICAHDNGHLQAVGTDEAGRRQYLYHEQWRLKRDEQKFLRVARAATRLTSARRQIVRDLENESLSLERACAVAVRLIDLGYFRIGSDAYVANESFGLTTLERRHVRRQGSALVFSFTGKSGIDHRIEIDDVLAIESLQLMRTRRGGGPRLLAFKADGRWRDLRAPDVNEYLSGMFEEPFTAKDLRTWHATVIAARELAGTTEAGDTIASRRRAVRAAVVSVSDYLGNTPAVARRSYVDPRIVERYEAGQVLTLSRAVRAALADPRHQPALEKATLTLLGRA